MKPSNFDYHNPKDEAEVFDLLAGYGADAKVLAGGQSLMPLMNFRLARPSVVVDINDVLTLSGVEISGSTLRLGALTRHNQLEFRADIRRYSPLLSLVAPFIGHPQIRTRGTLGGSLVHADPSAELPAAMLALDATIVVRCLRGERRVAAENFFKFHLTSDLEDDELVVAIEIPFAAANQGFGFHEVAARFGDFATVGAAAALTVGSDGKIQHARVVCMAVGPTPMRSREAENVLIGKAVEPEVLSELVEATSQSVDPAADIKVSAQYKRRTAGVLARRAVEDAWTMFQGRAS